MRSSTTVMDRPQTAGARWLARTGSWPAMGAALRRRARGRSTGNSWFHRLLNSVPGHGIWKSSATEDDCAGLVTGAQLVGPDRLPDLPRVPEKWPGPFP